MRTPVAALLVLAALHATAASARSPSISPLVGRWAVDVDSLSIPAHARPKSVVLEFRDGGKDRWTTQIEIVDPAGGRMRAESTLPLDGTPGPIAGNYWADVSAVTMPAPNVLVMQLADDGAPASTRIYSVTGDGNTLIETKAVFDEKGTPVLQTHRFKRLP